MTTYKFLLNIFIIGLSFNLVAKQSKLSLGTSTEIQKKVWFREMVNFDMSLRAAVSNASLANVFHTYRAFKAMSSYMANGNPQYRDALRKIKKSLKTKDKLQYANNIHHLASQATRWLKGKARVNSNIWKKVDVTIQKISMNCRACHLSK